MLTDLGELVGVLVAVLVGVLVVSTEVAVGAVVVVGAAVVATTGVVVTTGATVSAPPPHAEATNRNVKAITQFLMALSLSLRPHSCKLQGFTTPEPTPHISLSALVQGLYF